MQNRKHILKISEVSIKSSVVLLLTFIFLAINLLPLYALTPPCSVSSSYAQGEYYENLLSVSLTGDMRADIVAVAQSQIGYHESNSSSNLTGTASGSGNYTEYNRYMSEITNYNYYGGGWCGMFITWCAAMAGIPASVLAPSATAKPYGSYSFRFFGTGALEKASFVGFTDLLVKGGTYTPLPGDIIFYASSGYTGSPTGVNYKHVGIVESCTYTYNADNTIASMVLTTVEGNTTDRVSNKKWTIKTGGSGYVYSGCYIAGFGIPNYTTGIVQDTQTYDIGAYPGKLLQQGSSGTDVLKLQLALNLLCDSYPSVNAPAITGNFDTQTEKAVRQYQKALSLETDGVAGPATWSSVRQQLSIYTASIKSDCIVKDRKLLLYKGHSSSFVLPEGIETVSSGAFLGCSSLQSLHFPASLKTIEANAFLDCSSVKKITYLCTEEGFSSITLERTGNGVLFDAVTNYGICTITFIDLLGQEVDVLCKVGEMPKIPDFPEKIDDGEYIHYSMGWDSDILPATGDAVYTMVPLELIPSAEILVNLGKSLTMAGRTAHVELSLSEGEYMGAHLTVDYRNYTDRLRFSGCTGNLIVEEPEQGLLVIDYFKADTSENNTDPLKQILAGALIFEIADDASEGIISLDFITGEEDADSLIYKDDGVTKYPFNSAFEGGQLIIHHTALFDMDGDGTLTISDVTGLLNALSHQSHSSLNAPDSNFLSNDSELTISDVTALLNLLAMTEEERYADILK